MARTAITIQSLLEPFDNVAAGDLDFTFAAGDGSSGNSYVVTGKELLLAYNDGTSAKTITIDSVEMILQITALRKGIILPSRAG